MSQIHKAEASDAGCWVDGHWGQYGPARVVQMAVECGWDDQEASELASLKLASMGPSSVEFPDTSEEALIDAADSAESWLNANAAPNGYSFGWFDGEFFLSSDDDWQESAGEPCYVCGADHGASLCGYCDLCSDYHRSDEVCSHYLEAFERGYESGADSDSDPSEDDDTEPVGWHPSTLRAFERDCASFVEDNASDLLASGLPPERAGVDLWLTRNRHGAGFWDEDYGKPSPVKDALKRLTDAAHAAGSAELYIGSDGWIYQAGEEA